MNKHQFLYPRLPYHGKIQLKNLAFNANLQEFAHQVGYISNLHTGGKLSSPKAYEKLESLWDQLQSSKHSLNID